MIRHDRAGTSSSAKRRKQYAADRFRAIQTTASEMLNHDVFKSGAQLHDFDCGVKRSLMKCDLSQKQASDAGEALFGYDFHPVPNRRGPIWHFEPCCQRHGGLCGKQDICAYAGFLTHNLYATCRPCKDELPISLELDTRPTGWSPRSVDMFSLGAWLKKQSWLFIPQQIARGQTSILMQRSWCSKLWLWEEFEPRIHLPHTDFSYRFSQSCHVSRLRCGRYHNSGASTLKLHCRS